MRTNATRYVILGMLSEEPMAGYDIKKLVDLRFRFFWSESFGQIYPELKKLAKEGLVEALPDAAEAGGRQKKTYGITEAGKEVFGTWMNRKPEGEKQRFEFLLKIFWAPWLPMRRIDEYVGDFMDRHGRDLEMLRKMERELLAVAGKHPNHRWVLQTIRLGLRVNEAYLAWGSDFLAEMEGWDDEAGQN